MKTTIIFIFALITINCQQNNYKIKQIFPEGDKILYSEYISPELQRMVLFSLTEQKEYQLPMDEFSVSTYAKFYPDGEKILIKDTDTKDGIRILNLRSSEWEEKSLKPLNHPAENDYFEYDFIDSSVIVFEGLYNLFIISIETQKLLNKIAFTDTFFVSGARIIPEKDLLVLNYSDMGVKFENLISKIILYNYKTNQFSNYYYNTGNLWQKVPGTNYIYIKNNTPQLLDINTGERTDLQIKNMEQLSIIWPECRFIDKNRFLMKIYKKDDFFNTDIYLYDFRDSSLNQITHTGTFKTLLDFDIK